ncbi:hypothetical protein Ae201684_002573 [Aphanomyces euteiches]|uniref:L-ornithine N(5)-monooxygenase [NAD(P)H] n=1 Tax=Aphanomyces euteiches TaxID=100861 RepID=A0A6G0XPX0_9STRA|nr:hypothetical protein Ae201684_002573 [Aphanomyces euteiches]
MATKANTSNESVIPLLVIGAGPHALALVLNLLEEDSSAEFTEPETVKMSFWRSKLRGRHLSKRDLRRSIRVLDPSGTWCSTWNCNFATFGISHLRSPVSVHLDPLRPDGLRDYAVATNQLETQVSDPPQSIHIGQRSREFTNNTSIFNETDRQFLGCPSQKLFAAFNRQLVKQYGLDTLVQKTRAKTIEHLPDRTFRVTCDDGATLLAKNVVVAIGTLNIPRIPTWATPLRATDAKANVIHSSELVHDPTFPKRVRHKSILVIGGGLTSVHLTRQMLKWGAHHVTLATRKATLIVQPYDVPLDWLSPLLRQKKLAEFYAKETPEAKLACIREARRGGSVTKAALTDMQAVTTPDNFELLPNTTVNRVEQTADGRLHVEFKSSSMQVDVIVLATGGDIDVAKEPLFDRVRDASPVIVGGLPGLDADLRWALGMNLFVMGTYAALQMGPVAGNLMGARSGANRLGEILLEELLPRNEQTRQHHLRALCGKENLYDLLL